MAKKLKELDPKARSFEAGGQIFYIETKLSIARFHQYQILEKEAGFGVSFQTMVETIQEAYKDLNQLKAADASVKLYNLLSGIQKVAERENTLLKICALFMNTEDEDRGEIDEDLITKKINTWANEYEVGGFFLRALNTVDGFFQIYNEMRQITSGGAKETKKK